MKASVPYVQSFTDRHGRVRYYFRRAGFPRVPLPGPSDTKAFFDAYAKANAATRTGTKLDPRHERGTMGALLTEYLCSADFKQRKPNTRKLYERVIAMLRARPSVEMPVGDIRRRHILRLRDELSDTPGMANVVLSVVSLLMSFAVSRDYRDDNPATRIGRFRGGEFRSWSDAELARFEAHWPPGTMQRLAYDLALATGQRRIDLAAMDFTHRRDGRIRVVQEKTGAALWIPEHRDLRATLDAVRRQVGPILHGARGKRFSADYLGGWFASAIEAAGLPDECVLHGLRKAAARRLAEVGCTAHEIMAITGHKTLAEVERYTREVSQDKAGAAAIGKLEGRKDG